VPLDLGQPVWVDDPNFDLGYHIRRTAVPAPGDDAALCRLVARIMSQRLDRDRPLWESWVIEGLGEGRWAVLTKVHHCMADGISGNQLYSLMFDDSPTATGAVWCPAPEPSTVRLTVQALSELVLNPIEQVRLLVQGLRAPRIVMRRATTTVRGLAAMAGALIPVRSSSLSGPIGQPRRYGVARASLEDVADVAHAFHVSMNDVFLAAISGAFRMLLLHRGEQPNADSVRTLVPVSVRAHGDEGVLDNRISLLLPRLPVELEDPVDRLHAVHLRLTALKASKEAEAGQAMTSLAEHEPFAFISWGIRLAARLPQRNIVTVTTNVPGPRRPLDMLGRRVIEILPYVPIAVRLRFGVSIMTYCDRVSFGITSDYDSAPDVDLMAAEIEDGIKGLVKAARARGAAPTVRRGTRHRVSGKRTAAKA
jgi:diacylglycerol O-acyltransferase